MALISASTARCSRTAHGIATLIVAMTFFAAQDAMMKSLLQSYPIWMLLIIRSAVSVVLLSSLMLALGPPHRLASAFWRLHLLRGTLFAIAFSLFYAAFPFMPLAQVTTIFFSAPLMIVLLAAVFLRERIGAHRVAALISGFAGVLIALDPIGAGLSWVAVLPLLCAACYAVSQILARQIGERESSLTVGFHTMAVAAPVVLAVGYGVNATVAGIGAFTHLAWRFPAVSPTDASQLVLLGVSGMFAYVLLSRAYQVVWGEVPTASTLIGMTLIVGSGLYIGWRELRAAKGQGEPAITAETVIVPGAPPAVPSEENRCA